MLKKLFFSGLFLLELVLCPLSTSAEVLIDLDDELSTRTDGYTDTDIYKIPVVEMEQVSLNSNKYPLGEDGEVLEDCWVYDKSERIYYNCDLSAGTLVKTSEYAVNFGNRLYPLQMNIYVDGRDTLGEDCYIRFSARACVYNAGLLTYTNATSIVYTWTVPATAETFTVWLPTCYIYDISTEQVGFSTERECYTKRLYPPEEELNCSYDYSAYASTDYIVKGHIAHLDWSSDFPGKSYCVTETYGKNVVYNIFAGDGKVAEKETAAAAETSVSSTATTSPSEGVSGEDEETSASSVITDPAGSWGPTASVVLPTEESTANTGGGDLFEGTLPQIEQRLISLFGVFLFGSICFAVFGIGKTKAEREAAADLKEERREQRKAERKAKREQRKAEKKAEKEARKLGEGGEPDKR